MKIADSQLPPKVTTDGLRNHFKTTYKLAEEQVDIMLVSSVKSLTTSFSALYEALEKDDEFEEVFRLAHNLKGLLLNMGESQWAELARNLEMAATAKEKLDYHSLVREIQSGVADIL